MIVGTAAQIAEGILQFICCVIAMIFLGPIMLIFRKWKD